MLPITNVSITERAAIALDVRKTLARLGPDDIFALVFVSNFTNPDGTMVEGFVPGYSSAVTKWNDGDGCVLVRLPSGMEFYVIPRPRTGYELSPDASYAIDLIEPRHGTFTIELVTAG